MIGEPSRDQRPVTWGKDTFSSTAQDARTRL